MRLLAVLCALGLAGCVGRGRLDSAGYNAARASAFNVLNFGRRPVHFVFRVDGVQIVDTTVAIGGLPPLVLARVVYLTPGKHRLELYDTRNGEYHTQTFDVREGDMTIEVRLLDAHAELRTYYARVIYM